MTEKPWLELTRLVYDYQSGERQHRQEAWDLIAEFTIDNWLAICGALEYAALHTHSQKLPCRYPRCGCSSRALCVVDV